MTTAITTAKQSGGLVGLLEKSAPAIERALPRGMRPERMVRVLLTALRATPKLAQCSPVSFLACSLQLAALGLEPNTPLGLAYLIPRRIKGAMDCTMILGYQGMMELARRAVPGAQFSAEVVREGDRFEWSLGLTPVLVHVPAGDPDRERRPVIASYAIFRMPGQEPQFTVLSRAQIEERRKRSQAAGDGPWVTDFAAMAQKSALRALWKFLPKSVEVAESIAVDEALERPGRQLHAFGADVRAEIEAVGLEVPDEEPEPIEASAEPVATDIKARLRAKAAAPAVDPDTGEVQGAWPEGRE